MKLFDKNSLRKQVDGINLQSISCPKHFGIIALKISMEFFFEQVKDDEI